jgi:hypothetical protein
MNFVGSFTGRARHTKVDCLFIVWRFVSFASDLEQVPVDAGVEAFHQERPGSGRTGALKQQRLNVDLAESSLHPKAAWSAQQQV